MDHDRDGFHHHRFFRPRETSHRLRIVRFGKEVRRRRKAAGMTLEQLAEASELSDNYVRSIEKGDRDPSLTTITKLAKGLKIPAAELLGGLQELGPAGLEAGRLLESSPPDVQEAVLQLLRATSRRRR